jgi:hypothetical protein
VCVERGVRRTHTCGSGAPVPDPRQMGFERSMSRSARVEKMWATAWSELARYEVRVGSCAHVGCTGDGWKIRCGAPDGGVWALSSAVRTATGASRVPSSCTEVHEVSGKCRRARATRCEAVRL